MTDIFSYSDYRRFLRDLFDERKKMDPKFSQRYFANKAGIRSSGFLADCMAGKRNLSNVLIIKIASALKLKKDEADYFEHLVHFTQAQTLEERNHHFAHMLTFSKVNPETVNRERHEFYNAWYYSAIRELLYFYRFDGDYEKLGKALRPQIKAQQARRAIEVLEKLGFIRCNETGKYVQSTPLLTSGPESFYIANYHRSTLELASESINRIPSNFRSFSTLTMTMSRESFDIAQKEIQALRKRLLALAMADQNVDRVVQFNCQLFPISQVDD